VSAIKQHKPDIKYFFLEDYEFNYVPLQSDNLPCINTLCSIVAPVIKLSLWMYFEKWTHALCFNMYVCYYYPTFKLVMVRGWTLFYYRVETREENIPHRARQHSITPSYAHQWNCD